MPSSTAEITKNPFPGMREFYKFVGENFKAAEVKERKLKGKVYLIFIEKTEVFLSLEFFATWVMERRAIRVIKLSHIGFLAVDNKPVRVEYSLRLQFKQIFHYQIINPLLKKRIIYYKLKTSIYFVLSGL
jgi:hypothetical protein